MYSRMGLSELEEKRKRVNDLTQWLTAELDRRERTHRDDTEGVREQARGRVGWGTSGRVTRGTSEPQTVDRFKAHLKEQLRLEVASELGIDVVREGYFGGLTNSQCGKFGAVMQKRMVQLLKNRHMPKN